MEVTKETLIDVMQVTLYQKDYPTLQMLTGKCFNLSEVERIVFFEKENYCILGASVIDGEILKSSLDGKKEDFVKHLIPIRNQNEFDAFLKYISDKKERENQTLEEDESRINDQIKNIIRKYIPDEIKQENVFKVVKESSGLSGEQLLTKMDYVYKIVKSQQAVIAIFKANPKININKNTYSVKDRKLGGYLNGE